MGFACACKGGRCYIASFQSNRISIDSFSTRIVERRYNSSQRLIDRVQGSRITLLVFVGYWITIIIRLLEPIKAAQLSVWPLLKKWWGRPNNKRKKDDWKKKKIKDDRRTLRPSQKEEHMKSTVLQHYSFLQWRKSLNYNKTLPKCSSSMYRPSLSNRTGLLLQSKWSF